MRQGIRNQKTVYEFLTQDADRAWEMTVAFLKEQGYQQHKRATNVYVKANPQTGMLFVEFGHTPKTLLVYAFFGSLTTPIPLQEGAAGTGMKAQNSLRPLFEKLHSLEPVARKVRPQKADQEKATPLEESPEPAEIKTLQQEEVAEAPIPKEPEVQEEVAAASAAQEELGKDLLRDCAEENRQQPSGGLENKESATEGFLQAEEGKSVDVEGAPQEGEESLQSGFPGEDDLKESPAKPQETEKKTVSVQPPLGYHCGTSVGEQTPWTKQASQKEGKTYAEKKPLGPEPARTTGSKEDSPAADDGANALTAAILGILALGLSLYVVALSWNGLLAAILGVVAAIVGVFYGIKVKKQHRPVAIGGMLLGVAALALIIYTLF